LYCLILVYVYIYGRGSYISLIHFTWHNCLKHFETKIYTWKSIVRVDFIIILFLFFIKIPAPNVRFPLVKLLCILFSVKRTRFCLIWRCLSFIILFKLKKLSITLFICTRGLSILVVFSSKYSITQCMISLS